jgi:hypothetical protein
MIENAKVPAPSQSGPNLRFTPIRAEPDRCFVVVLQLHGESVCASVAVALALAHRHQQADGNFASTASGSRCRRRRGPGGRSGLEALAGHALCRAQCMATRDPFEKARILRDKAARLFTEA